MNKDTLASQWHQLKGSVRSQWGHLTNDDVETINCDFERMVGRLQERYGHSREATESAMTSWRH